MDKSLSYKLNKNLNLYKVNFFIALLLILVNFKSSFCDGPSKIYQPNPYENSGVCYDYPYLYDEQCFNAKLTFTDKKYQAHNFAINKKGDLVIEFTEYKEDDLSSSRLFYGLTKEGRYFFSNETSYTYETNIDVDEFNYWDYGLYEYYDLHNSKSLFVSIKNDPNKENQYLFSINTFNFMVELHNLTNDNNSYLVWNFDQFFQLDHEEYVIFYEYSLFELKKESAYIIVFVPKLGVFEEMENSTFIKKFRFRSFDKDAYEELGSIQYKDYVNNFIIGTFFMDDCNTLVVISTFYYKVRVPCIGRRVPGTNVESSYEDPIGGVPVSYEEEYDEDENLNCFENYPDIGLKFYTNNLIHLNFGEDYMPLNLPIFNLANNYMDGIFFRALYLKNKNVLSAFVTNNNYELGFILVKIDYNYGGGITNAHSSDLYIDK